MDSQGEDGAEVKPIRKWRRTQLSHVERQQRAYNALAVRVRLFTVEPKKKRNNISTALGQSEILHETKASQQHDDELAESKIRKKVTNSVGRAIVSFHRARRQDKEEARIQRLSLLRSGSSSSLMKRQPSGLLSPTEEERNEEYSVDDSDDDRSERDDLSENMPQHAIHRVIHDDEAVTVICHEMSNCFLANPMGTLQFFEVLAVKRALLVEADINVGQTVMSEERILEQAELFHVEVLQQDGKEQENVVLTRVISPVTLANITEKWVHERQARNMSKLRALLDLSRTFFKPNRFSIDRAIYTHKYWELAQQPSNHMAFTCPENIHLVQALVDALSAQMPCTTLNEEEAMRSQHFLSAAALTTFMAHPPTRRILLSQGSISSTVVESSFMSLKRIPAKLLNQSKAIPSAKVLLELLAFLALEKDTHAALLRSRKIYTELLLTILADSLSSDARLRAVHVLLRALSTQQGMFHEHHDVWEAILSTTFHSNFLPPRQSKRAFVENRIVLRTIQLHVLYFGFKLFLETTDAEVQVPQSTARMLMRMLHSVAEEVRTAKETAMHPKDNSADEQVKEFLRSGSNRSILSDSTSGSLDSARSSRSTTSTTSSASSVASVNKALYQRQQQDPAKEDEILEMILIYAVGFTCALVYKSYRKIAVELCSQVLSVFPKVLSLLRSKALELREGKTKHSSSDKNKETLKIYENLEVLLLGVLVHVCRSSSNFPAAASLTPGRMFELFSIGTLENRLSVRAKMLHAQLLYYVSLRVQPLSSRELDLVKAILLEDGASKSICASVKRYLAAAFAVSCGLRGVSFDDYYDFAANKFFKADSPNTRDRVVVCYIHFGLLMVLHQLDSSPFSGPDGFTDPRVRTMLKWLSSKDANRLSTLALLRCFQVLLHLQFETQASSSPSSSSIQQSAEAFQPDQTVVENLERIVNAAVALLSESDEEIIAESLQILWIIASYPVARGQAPTLISRETISAVFQIAMQSSLSSQVAQIASGTFLALATLDYVAVVLALHSNSHPLLATASEGEQQQEEEEKARAESDNQDVEHTLVSTCADLLAKQDLQLKGCGAFLYSRHRIRNPALNDLFRRKGGLRNIKSLVQQNEDIQARCMGLLAMIQATEYDKLNQRLGASKRFLTMLAEIIRSGGDHEKQLVGAVIRNLLKHAENRSAIYKMELYLRLPDQTDSYKQQGNNMSPTKSKKKKANVRETYENWLQQVEREQKEGFHHLLFKQGKKGLEEIAAASSASKACREQQTSRSKNRSQSPIETQHRLRRPIANLWSPRGSFSLRSPQGGQTTKSHPFLTVDTQFGADSPKPALATCPVSSPKAWSPRLPNPWSPRAKIDPLSPISTLKVVVEQDKFVFKGLDFSKSKPDERLSPTLQEESFSSPSKHQVNGTFDAATNHTSGQQAFVFKGDERDKAKSKGSYVGTDEVKRQKQQVLRERVKAKMRNNFRVVEKEGNQDDHSSLEKETKTSKQQTSAVEGNTRSKPRMDWTSKAYNEAYSHEEYGKASLTAFRHIDGGRVYKDMPAFDIPGTDAKTYFFFTGAHEPLYDMYSILTSAPQVLPPDPAIDIPEPPFKAALVKECLETLHQQAPCESFFPAPVSPTPIAYSLDNYVGVQQSSRNVRWTETGVIYDDPVPLLLVLPFLAAKKAKRKRSSIFASHLWDRNTLQLSALQNIELGIPQEEEEDEDEAQGNLDTKAYSLEHSIFCSMTNPRRPSAFNVSFKYHPSASMRKRANAFQGPIEMLAHFEANWAVLLDKAQFRKLVDRDASVDSIRILMENNYSLLHEVFKFYSAAVGNTSGTFTMQLNEYCTFVRDLGLLKKRANTDKAYQIPLPSNPDNVINVVPLDTGSVDTIFIIANKTLPESLLDETRKHLAGSKVFQLKHDESLHFYEFLEVLIRISDGTVCQSAKRSGASTVPPLNDAVEAVLEILSSRFKPEIILNCNQFRLDRMYNWAVDGLLKENLEMFQSLFERYTCLNQVSKAHGASAKEQMSLTDWLEFVQDMNLLNVHFNKRDASWIFCASTSWHVDPFKQWKDIVTLDFAQFLEAILRMADCVFIPDAKQLHAVGILPDTGMDGFSQVAEFSQKGIVGFYSLMNSTNLWNTFEKPMYTRNATQLQMWFQASEQQQGQSPPSSPKVAQKITTDSCNGFYDSRPLDYKLTQLLKVILFAETSRQRKQKDKLEWEKFAKQADVDQKGIFRQLIQLENNAQDVTAPSRRRLSLDIQVAQNLAQKAHRFSVSSEPAYATAEDSLARLSPQLKKSILILSHHACEIVREASNSFEQPDDPGLEKLLLSKEFLTKSCIQLQRLHNMRSRGHKPSNASLRQGGIDEDDVEEEDSADEDQEIVFRALDAKNKEFYLVIMTQAVMTFLQKQKTDVTTTDAQVQD